MTYSAYLPKRSVTAAGTNSRCSTPRTPSRSLHRGVRRPEELQGAQRFGNYVTEPGGELSRDYRDFYLTPKYGRLSLKVEYCGHRVADDGRPVTKEGKLVEEIALEQLN